MGHAGTLDPKASGLLIVCTGAMTKKINTFVNFEKEYEGILRIGATTKTFDSESEEENLQSTERITDEIIQQTASRFLGNIKQTPPIYSAIKYNGKPLYYHARKGIHLIPLPREITISSFTIKKLDKTNIWFNVVCSKGTYIRSIADDFGKQIGCGAYLKNLKRTRIGNFVLENFIDSIKNIQYKVISYDDFQ